PEQDLSFFSNFPDLSVLLIHNDDQEKINQGIYNRFVGSLEPLKNLTKIERLYIDNTDIDSGLEYLPESVKDFNCSTDKRKDAKVKAIYDLLVNEPGKDFGEKLRSYRQRLKEEKTYEQGESELLSTRSELPVIIPAQTELKNIDPAN